MAHTAMRCSVCSTVALCSSLIITSSGCVSHPLEYILPHMSGQAPNHTCATPLKCCTIHLLQELSGGPHQTPALLHLAGMQPCLSSYHYHLGYRDTAHPAPTEPLHFPSLPALLHPSYPAQTLGNKTPLGPPSTKDKTSLTEVALIVQVLYPAAEQHPQASRALMLSAGQQAASQCCHPARAQQWLSTLADPHVS